ncbi:MAG: hypothetical protein CVV03_07850 [Firmicutes bacterium HGW-Firmicutes-8]|nr:MAG: hypothetical protein CVV03_07850 [Firmicutes bacterium HGW-Firmicutes-8]
MSKKISSWHVGVAAEAFAAGVFARCGYDVSVQYGANQPEYDLIISKGEKLLKVSVKGSQDGGWGLTQSYMKNRDYHQAAHNWMKRHRAKTIICFVQFINTDLLEMPRLYLATPYEVAEFLKQSANGRGDTILQEEHHWGPRAYAAGTVDKIPDKWIFLKERVEELFDLA